MTLSRYNVEALEGCRMAVGAEVGHLGAAGDHAGQIQPDASTFGLLPAAAQLTEAIARFAGNLATQYDAAEQRLRGVERALDSVQLTVAETEVAGVRDFTPPAP